MMRIAMVLPIGHCDQTVTPADQQTIDREGKSRFSSLCGDFGIDILNSFQI